MIDKKERKARDFKVGGLPMPLKRERDRTSREGFKEKISLEEPLPVWPRTPETRIRRTRG